ncbi:MAG TPA: four helix bundle protein [Candidatus Moranbacteria bacterium]|nr:four helix bundle protein [Candidatus Moranbacteria bacterium]
MQPYKKLFTYWFAVVIYDHEVEFCKRWIKSFKLKEQMDGAARSGKQNIVEGSDDMGISLKVAIKLTGIAKGSLEELIGDLEDFLRQNGLKEWGKDDPRTKQFRQQSSKLIKYLAESNNVEFLKSVKLPSDPERAANWLLTLCHQATYLLHKQVEALKNKHMKEGGFTENLYNKRKEYRGY